MTNEIQTLQDLAHLASRRNDGKRGRALEREAQKHDLVLSRSTFDSILAGRYTSTPKRETVDALAVLAGVSKETAYRVAGLPLPQAPLAEQLPPDVDTLGPDQRRALIEMARVLVKQNRQIHELQRKVGDGDAEATPLSDAGGTPATGDDDGLGSFGGRAHGDLDHDSKNDGTGDNVRPLRGKRQRISTEKLAQLEELQRRGDSANDDDIEGWAAYEPDDEDGEQ